jgi:hypothetical protein
MIGTKSRRCRVEALADDRHEIEAMPPGKALEAEGAMPPGKALEAEGGVGLALEHRQRGIGFGPCR